MFEISFIKLTGSVLKLQVESTTHLCELKQQIAEKEVFRGGEGGSKNPRDQFRLIFGGKELFACSTPSCTKDCRQLQDLGIGDGAKISLVLRLAGD